MRKLYFYRSLHIIALQRSARCILPAGFLFLAACATPAPFYEKKTDLSFASTECMHGVRIYEGNLPENIQYEFIGTVDACSTDSNFLGESLHSAREEMTRQAKLMGANAIIEARQKEDAMEICLAARAVKLKEFPETFSLPDLSRVTTYTNASTVKTTVAGAFGAAKALLEADLFAIESASEKTGIIITKEEEVSTGKMKWRKENLGGPYPLLTIKIIVEKRDADTVTVTRIDTFRGASWTRGQTKVNADSFFADLLQYLP